MERSARSIENLALALGVLLAVVLLWLRLASEGLLEMGDGVTHYMIARYAGRHPELFLDLWGKPLFTLLAWPFAQVGHAGVALFNAVVACATAVVGTRTLRRAGGAAQLAYPLLVLLAPQYVLMVMAGMTEPLFGLVTVMAVRLLLDERHALALAVASLAPFARPEYVAFLPLVMLWTAYERRWRALPWAFLGLAAYALLAAMVKGDLLWFWSGDPYQHADGVYGSGPLDFFVARAEMIYGRPLLTLGLAALVLWPVVHHFDRNERRAHRLMLVTAMLPVLGIVAIHSWLWYTGIRGSAGLLRVVVTSIPLAGLFTAFTIGRGATLLVAATTPRLVFSGLFVLALGAWSVTDLLKQQQLPIEPEMNQRFLDAAAFSVKRHYREGLRVYSTHPYMAFRAEIDPYDSAVYNPLWGLSEETIAERFRTGDLLVWDAQLGSNEAGVPLDKLLNDGRFAVLEALEPPTGSRVLGGHVYEIFLFERRDVVRSYTIDTLVWNGVVRGPLQARGDTVPCAEPRSGRWCLKEGEFPLEFRDLPLPSVDAIYDEWMVSAKATVEEGSRLTIVFSQNVDGHGVRYDEEDVRTGDLWFNRRVPPAGAGTGQALYFWNMGKRPFTLEGLTVLRKRWTQRPL
jgi:hypothetical protein